MKNLVLILICFMLNSAYGSTISCKGQCVIDSSTVNLNFKLSSGHGGSGSINLDDCPGYSLEYRWTGDGLLGVALIQGSKKIAVAREIWPMQATPLEVTGIDPKLELGCFFESSN